MSIRILLADDHAVVRHGLRAALEQEADMTVVAEASGGEEALALCREHRPQVVLMDIHMPGISGDEATRRILAELPATKVLALSMYDQERYVRGMLEAGASGYLLKNCDFEELTAAIRKALEGKTHLSPEAAAAVVKMAVRPRGAAGSGGGEPLSDREKEVVSLVARGLTSKEIGSRLHISENTVETHRRRIMNKLGISNVAELTKYALRAGLASLDD